MNDDTHLRRREQTKTNQSQVVQPEPTPAGPKLTLPGTVLGAITVIIAAGFLTWALHAAIEPTSGNSYKQWLARLPGSLIARSQWALADISEAQFYRSPIAGVGLLIGATLAWWAGRRGYRWAGRPISYGSGLWPWVFGAGILSLILSNIAFGQNLGPGWQPTFVPFVCVASALVLVHGRGWPILLTGAVLGAVTTTPLAMLLIATVTDPLGLPTVVANTLAMSIGTTVCFLICRALPWVSESTAPEAASESPSPATARRTVKVPTAISDAVWTARRVLTDFSEAQFYATELASLGILGGVIIAALLDPSLPAYGTGLLPQILFAQVLTSAIGVVVWRKLYRNGGFVPTYISVVSVAPAAVLAYNGGIASIILGALGGALLAPLVARPISSRLPPDFHPFIGNTTSMAVSTAIIVPLIGLIPGVS